MITADFLHRVATFTNDQVTKVVLNGAFEITNFEVKRVIDNTVSLKFMVPFGSVSTIKRIDLLDGSGAIVSTNAVDVPVTSDTIMLQTLTIKEV